MQEINRKYPKTNSKLSGEYLRIFASTADERNEIIDFLKGRGQPPDGTTNRKARVGRLRGRDNSSPPKMKRNQKVIENDVSGTFGFMDAIIELKKFFAEYLSLIELGKQLRNAQPHEKVDVFYRHIANQR
ncbi:hypothetical protein TNCV_1826011 [Trichonephila clavipes]|nr:hypothetical protein TNCV_1826011 [Trichonephila clavipes]